MKTTGFENVLIEHPNAAASKATAAKMDVAC